MSTVLRDAAKLVLRIARSGLPWAAAACPALLFLLVWSVDVYRRPLWATAAFFALAAFALAAARHAKPRAGGAILADRFWARGADAWGLRFVALAALGLLLLLVSDRPYQGMPIYPIRTTGFWVVVCLTGGALAFVVNRPPKPWVMLVVLIAGAASIRAFGPGQWVMDPWVRDMLPLVRSALDTFLAGDDPYGVHTMQIGSQVPLTYPPALWLAYLPARVMGVDIRWTSWIADGVVAAALALPALRARAESPGEVARPAWPVLLCVAAYLFLPDTHWNGIYAEPQPDWAVLAVLACCIAMSRPLAAGGALGVALAMRPLNLVFLPLVAAGFWRIHGLRTAARAMLIAAGVAATFYVPFVLWDPDAFYLGTVRWLVEYGPAHRGWFGPILGFAGPMYGARLEAWMPVAQVSGVLVTMALVARYVRTPRGLLTACAAAYALFVAFNSIIWMSFWIGAVILVSAATAAPASAPACSDSRVRERGSLPSGVRARLRAALVPAGLVVAAGIAAYLAFLLARHFSEEGRASVRTAILARARPGDLVLDRTGWRLAFLKFPWVVAGPDLPAGVTVAADPFSAALPERRPIMPGDHPRILAVDRFDLFDGDRAAYAEIYRTVSEERFGRFRLTALERAVGDRPAVFFRDIEHLAVTMETPTGTRVASTAPDRPYAWRFEEAPDWQEVRRQTCLHAGLATPAIWAHPRPTGPVVLAAPLPPGAAHVLVAGGLMDDAVEWMRAPVDVEVRAGGRELALLRCPNAPGRRGRALALPADLPARSVLELRITAPQPGRRHFCVDALVW